MPFRAAEGRPAVALPFNTVRGVLPGMTEVDLGREFVGVMARVAAGVPGAVAGFAAFRRCSVLMGNLVLCEKYGTSGLIRKRLMTTDRHVEHTGTGWQKTEFVMERQRSGISDNVPTYLTNTRSTRTRCRRCFCDKSKRLGSRFYLALEPT